MIYRLRLYVDGRNAQSQRAIQNLQEICRTDLKGLSELEVIDVLENPALAERQKIMATPTLVKEAPQPVRKILGDLSDRERVLRDLPPGALAPAPPDKE